MQLIGLLMLQLENYQQQLEEMKNMSRQEYVAHLRRYKSIEMLLFCMLIGKQICSVTILKFCVCSGEVVVSQGGLQCTEG